MMKGISSFSEKPYIISEDTVRPDSVSGCSRPIWRLPFLTSQGHGLREAACGKNRTCSLGGRTEASAPARLLRPTIAIAPG